MSLMTEDEAIRLLEDAVEDAGSQRRYAIRHNLHPNMLSSVLKRHMALSAPSILGALGLRKIVLYEMVDESKTARKSI